MGRDNNHHPPGPRSTFSSVKEFVAQRLHFPTKVLQSKSQSAIGKEVPALEI